MAQAIAAKAVMARAILRYNTLWNVLRRHMADKKTAWHDPVGGSACVRPDGVQVGELTRDMIDEIILTETYEKLARDAGVEIRLSTEVTKEYAEKENADTLITTVGPEPLVPPISGLDGDNAVAVNNDYREKDKAGSEVVAGRGRWLGRL